MRRVTGQAAASSFGYRTVTVSTGGYVAKSGIEYPDTPLDSVTGNENNNGTAPRNAQHHQADWGYSLAGCRLVSVGLGPANR